MTTAFSRNATVLASTTRMPLTDVTGKSGTAVTVLSDLRCTPLYPVDPETARRQELRTPLKALATFVDGDQDLVEGDRLKVVRGQPLYNSKEFPVQKVAKWPWRGDIRMQVFLEDLRK